MTRTKSSSPTRCFSGSKTAPSSRIGRFRKSCAKAAEHSIISVPEDPKPKAVWRFPTLDCGGDFLTDPASLRPEADAIL